MTTFESSAVEAALEPVRSLVAADGGDIVLDSLDGVDVRLRLVLDTAECRECVMPSEFLAKIADDMMRPALPALGSVHIDDPREPT